MFKKTVFTAVVISMTLGLQAQYVSHVTEPDTSLPTTSDETWSLAQTITASDLKQHLYLLASDSLGGRELGTRGNLMAADYIAGQFRSDSLDPVLGQDDYFQDVAFTWLFWDDISMTINGERFKQLWDFVAFPDKNRTSEISTKSVTFAGYGIQSEDYSDYKNIDVKNKVILIYDGEPISKNGTYLLTDDETPSIWSDSLDLKLNAASEKGASHVLIVSNDIKKIVNENRRQLLGPKVILGKAADGPRAPVDYTFISSTMAKTLIAGELKKVIKARRCIAEKGKAKPFEFDTDLELIQKHRQRSADGVNVAAYSKGASLSDEYILISAHYDHIGQKGKDINNGADDNASGTSTVLEIAEAFATARKMGISHERSVVFLLVTGEEKGLLGSKYYVENPLVPIDQSMVNINIDMVGRIHKKYTNNPNYIYVIGSDRLSSQLHKVNEDVNQKYTQLVLDYQYNAESDPNRFYYRSDHYNFAQKGIPAIFFFNGTHQDYHRPTDTPEKIQYDKMSLVAKHIFTLAWELANREEAISVDVEP